MNGEKLYILNSSQNLLNTGEIDLTFQGQLMMPNDIIDIQQNLVEASKLLKSIRVFDILNFDARWCIHAVNWVIIGLGNGLLPVPCQIINFT